MARIKVFTSNSMRTMLNKNISHFERHSGHSADISFDPAEIALKRIEQGESADLAVLGEAAMEKLVKQGKIAGATRRPLVRSSAGIGVRAGSSHPDISSVESFRKTLLDARAIAYASEGASGIHFVRVLEKLGIADQVKAKSTTRPGGLLAELLVSGEVDLAIQHFPELMAVAGVEVVGPFPPGIEFANVLAAGIFSGTAHPAAVAELMNFLTSPHAAGQFRAEGLEVLF
jgi:molybdate transport system substrate-binding protein